MKSVSQTWSLPTAWIRRRCFFLEFFLETRNVPTPRPVFSPDTSSKHRSPYSCLRGVLSVSSRRHQLPQVYHLSLRVYHFLQLPLTFEDTRHQQTQFASVVYFRFARQRYCTPKQLGPSYLWLPETAAAPWLSRRLFLVTVVFSAF